MSLLGDVKLPYSVRCLSGHQQYVVELTPTEARLPGGHPCQRCGAVTYARLSGVCVAFFSASRVAFALDVAHATARGAMLGVMARLRPKVRQLSFPPGMTVPDELKELREAAFVAMTKANEPGQAVISGAIVVQANIDGPGTVVLHRTGPGPDEFEPVGVFDTHAEAEACELGFGSGLHSALQQLGFEEMVPTPAERDEPDE